MLPDSMVSQLISLQIPALAVMMQPTVKKGVCKVIHDFADYTGNMIRVGEFQEVKRCFGMAAVLYHNGSQSLRNAIESVYLYALSPLLCTRHSNMPVKELLPVALRNVRIQQLQNCAV